MNEIQYRRSFLKLLSLSSAYPISSYLLPEFSHAAIQDIPESADQLIKGKSSDLIVLKPYPAVLETPLSELARHKITPISHLFVRNNSQPKESATIAAAPLRDWQIEIGGLTNRSAVKVDISELPEFEQVEVEMVLQCSGNSRSLYAGTVETSGTQWGKGGMGNVKFAGVRLHQLLDKKGIEIEKSARFIRATGRDNPLEGKEDFEHSLPITDVLSRSILATHLNGERLPAIHGGPIRLITPGIYGTMHIKWLSGLYFENEETDNYNHVPRYRVPKKPIKPGTKVDFTHRNSDFNWSMKVKSVVLSPGPESKAKAGLVPITGVAFNDGSCPIETVLISVDQGATWQRAKLERPTSHYAWTRFEVKLKLNRGKHTIWTRAVDQYGRSQPLNGHIAWNPRGYEWNGVEKIGIEVL